MDQTAKTATAQAARPEVERDWSRSAWTWASWITLGILLIWSWSPAEMFRWTFLVSDAGNMAEYASGFARPDFSQWRYYIDEMLVTIQIALWGTFLAAVVAVPFGILSARNIAPWYVVQPVRRLMDACRSIHELVFAVLFVVAVGLGPFAGVMALFVHTTGILAKLFSEAVEAIDARPVEAIRATGASRLQEVVFGVVPQVMPLWMSYALYRFESNVRAATVLGVIGAGGIGQVLFESIRGFYYPQASAMLIIMLVTVSLIDLLSQQLRKLFL
ncbi:phosphonate ABC transporter, permease protein PhnE [Kumtagia ephedrae]|uniref:Phosphonate ABC transporter, permease protein PhnE n=1 Tax=Kumtagia ephedrae TaxID=2116701 RepID=A0A2P7SS97_9HYPH|nr:phosphonate ABC transporter, permease protein PhnE [Mesorhizobium ephedrae]PSJ65317.1 phosphonate ABC transporter, permease protein PhnE [Mesorhizobium ephedrae]